MELIERVLGGSRRAAPPRRILFAHNGISFISHALLCTNPGIVFCYDLEGGVQTRHLVEWDPRPVRSDSMALLALGGGVFVLAIGMGDKIGVVHSEGGPVRTLVNEGELLRRGVIQEGCGSRIVWVDGRGTRSLHLLVRETLDGRVVRTLSAMVSVGEDFGVTSAVAYPTQNTAIRIHTLDARRAVIEHKSGMLEVMTFPREGENCLSNWLVRPFGDNTSLTAFNGGFLIYRGGKNVYLYGQDGGFLSSVELPRRLQNTAGKVYLVGGRFVPVLGN